MKVRVQNAELTALDEARKVYRRRYAALQRQAERATDAVAYGRVMVKLAEENGKLAAAMNRADATAQYIEVPA